MIVRRLARTRGDLATAIALGITAAAMAGCYGPAECTELKNEQFKVPLANVTVAEDGSFDSLERGHFASCRTFCAVESGVDTVNDCEGPTQVAQRWEIRCDVEATQCGRKQLIGLPGHGRRPEGFCPDGASAESLGEYFAYAAQLEAVSVPAFQRLARELVAHRAPQSLVRAARRAANDEVKHTRMMRALARHFGVEPELPRIGMRAVRSLSAIAIENVVEGCVGETLGAIVATVQAERATDLRIRRAMTIIAKDETEHAILAWRVHEWIMSQLDGAARAAVNDALRAATVALEAGSVGVAAPALRERAGFPDAAATQTMLASARQGLWGRAA